MVAILLLVLIASFAVASRGVILRPGYHFPDQEIAVGGTLIYSLRSLEPDVCYEARVSTIGGTGVELTVEVRESEDSPLRSTGRTLLDTERSKFVLDPGVLFTLADIQRFVSDTNLVLLVSAHADEYTPLQTRSAVRFSLQLERFYFGLLPHSALSTVVIIVAMLAVTFRLVVPMVLNC